MDRGWQNSVNKRIEQLSRLKERSLKKPDIDALKKLREEEQLGVWSAYITRQQKNRKKIDKAKKTQTEKIQNTKLNYESHLEEVKQNQNHIKQAHEDKIRELEQKKIKIGEQCNFNDERRTLYSLKQKELEHLRQQDNTENQEKLKTHRFLENCKIIEKHLALSMLNNERRQFLNNFNDKYRNKMAKERLLLKIGRAHV